MAGANNAHWETLEQWSPRAFAVSGVGLLALSIAGGLHVAGVVPSPAWLHMGLLVGGIWFVFLGLLGFYPYVAELAPRLSLGGLLTSVIGGVAITVALMAAVVVDLTTQRTFAEGPSWGPPILALAFILALLSFLCYGVASSRTNSPSRTVGLLLLVPVVAFLGQSFLLITKILGDAVSGSLQLALAGITAIALIAVGYVLRTDTEPTERTEPAPDPTAK